MYFDSSNCLQQLWRNDSLQIHVFERLEVVSVFFQIGLGIDPSYFFGSNQNLSVT